MFQLSPKTPLQYLIGSSRTINEYCSSMLTVLTRSFLLLLPLYSR